MSDKSMGDFGHIEGNPHEKRIITPYQDGRKAFTDFFSKGKKKARSIIFSATLDVYFENLKRMKNQGMDVKAIFDYDESQSEYESPHIQDLVTHGWKPGEDFLIGHSPESSAYLHLKSTWLDDRWIEGGSFDYSHSALDELNSIVIMDWPEYAQYLDKMFNELETFINRVMAGILDWSG